MFGLLKRLLVFLLLLPIRNERLIRNTAVACRKTDMAVVAKAFTTFKAIEKVASPLCFNGLRSNISSSALAYSRSCRALDVYPREANAAQGRTEKAGPTAGTGDLSKEALTEEFSKVYRSLMETGQVEAGLVSDKSIGMLKAKEMYYKSLRGWAPGKGERGLLKAGARSFSTTALRTFATTSGQFQKKDKKGGCDKATQLPCLQASEIGGKAPSQANNKTVCEKICMPCCKPARDPPTCFFPYVKPPCKIHKNPRQAYSECKKIIEPKPYRPCECLPVIKSTCKASGGMGGGTEEKQEGKC